MSQLTYTEKIFGTLQKVLSELDIESYKSLLISHATDVRKGLGANEQESSSKSFHQFQKFLLLLFDKSIGGTGDTTAVQLQEVLLANLKIFLDFQVYTTITSKIFPSVCTVFSTTTSLKVKNLTIQSFILMINGMSDKNLDNYILVEKLLPLIQNTSPSNFKNSKLLLNTIKLYECLFRKLSKGASTISVNKQEVNTSDLITESIFFQLWKMSRYISSKSDLDSVFTTLTDIEQYLKKEITKHVQQTERENMNSRPSPRIERSPNISAVDKSHTSFPSTNSNSNKNNSDSETKGWGDDDFGDFADFETSNSSTTQKQQDQYQQQQRRSSHSPVSQRMQLKKQTAKQKLSFGATSTSSNNVSHNITNQLSMNSQLQQQRPGSDSPNNTYSVMQPMNAHRVSGSPSSGPGVSNNTSNSNNTGIDWSKANTTTKPSWETSTNTSPANNGGVSSWEVMTPTNTTSSTMTSNNSNISGTGSYGLFEPIKPTRKLNSSTNNGGISYNNHGVMSATKKTSSTATGAGNGSSSKLGTPDFFDSLI
ncbi:unnamed protein product [Ambrosiozyma monospora]|uniref:Unnamed protein product n=1 Tax=Ambrosiozyma monospora TaxID=43982 RepID=A0ACB5SU43_AMBMO|nr:unnamed protein product [Ambrosiozyma monospora]